MLKLYYAKNTIAVAAAIALNEGVHWEARRVDFASAEQTKPDYLDVNPKGRVPTLITPEGPLTEVGAILEYIAETAVPSLMPADPLQKARVREIMFYLATTMHVNHAHGPRGARWANEPSSFEDMKAKVPETMGASCAFLEPQVVGPYIFGAELTLADCYLYPILRWLEGDGVNIEEYPALAKLKSAMEDRPSVQKTAAQGIFD